MGKRFTEYSQFDLSQVNKDVLKKWDENQVFAKSMTERDGCPSFVFFEGPPSANGMPGIHHVMARTIKDIFCRYKTMKGYQVKRKAGWHIDGKRIQTIKEHLEGTADLAGMFASKFGKEDWGFFCGMLHDIGKYSNEFQKRICGESEAQVDHSTAGARVCEKMGSLYSFMSYCIAGHHAGLPDYGSSSDTGSTSTLLGRRKKKICDYHRYQEEIQIPEISTLPFDPKKVKDQDFSLSIFIRMLYSCLVDADFLDTEAFMKNGNTGRVSGEEIDQLLQKLESYTKDWMKNKDIDTVNGRRTEILQNCYEIGKSEKGLFRLTVPTGGGKTIASLAFALKHAVEHHMDRVIYVIPYTSIIEQNAKIFRDILGEENVLENHCNVDYESSEEFKPMQLAAENWDKPVIVTTNVQFFESLFANRSSKSVSYTHLDVYKRQVPDSPLPLPYQMP